MKDSGNLRDSFLIDPVNLIVGIPIRILEELGYLIYKLIFC